MASKVFPLLVVAAWACVAALVRLESRWLYLVLALAVAIGLWVGRRQAVYLRVLLVLALVYPAWKKIGHWRSRTARVQGTSEIDDARVISALVASEETYLALTPKMAALSNDLLGVHLPGPQAAMEKVFARTVKVTDLGPERPEKSTGEGIVETYVWSVARSATEVEKVNLWRPLLDGVEHFDHARLYLVGGEHLAGDMMRYEAKCRFDALAQMKSGEWRSLSGKVNLTWERARLAYGELGQWQIARWETEEMHWIASPKRLFAESLDTAMRVPEEAAKLRRSGHYEATVKFYREGMKSPPHPYFSTISANQKEGLAVADIDGDGFDDIYITVRIGKNLLLHNNGDGTFTEKGGVVWPGSARAYDLRDLRRL
jgi:hypothetical protein